MRSGMPLRAAVRRLVPAAWALGGELAWHLLGPAWAFAVLAAALAWLAGWLPAAIISAAAAAEKAHAVERRVNALVPDIAAAHTTATTANSRVSSLSGRATTTSGLANGTVNGSISSAGLPDGTTNGYSSSAGLPDGTINGTSGFHAATTSGVVNGPGVGQHYHDYSHSHDAGGYSVTNGNHSHGPGSYAVTNGNHSHGTSGLAVANGNHSHDLPDV